MPIETHRAKVMKMDSHRERTIPSRFGMILEALGRPFGFRKRRAEQCSHKPIIDAQLQTMGQSNLPAGLSEAQGFEDSPIASPPSDDLESLRLPALTYRRLHSLGIKTRSQVRSLTRDYVLETPGLGQIGLEEIETVIGPLPSARIAGPLPSHQDNQVDKDGTKECVENVTAATPEDRVHQEAVQTIHTPSSQVEEQVADAVLALAKDYDEMPLERLGLSPRTFNCLWLNKIRKVGQLLHMTEPELLSLRWLGPKSLKELKERLADMGLALGSKDSHEVSEVDREIVQTIHAPFSRVEEQAAGAVLAKHYYEMPLERLGLSPRAFNCLRRNRITKVGQVLEMTKQELLSLKKLGRKSVQELQERLSDMGLALKSKESDETLESQVAPTLLVKPALAPQLQSEDENISRLGLRPRTYNLLYTKRIRKISNLAALSEDDLLAIRGLGPKGLEEIKTRLKLYLMPTPDAEQSPITSTSTDPDREEQTREQTLVWKRLSELVGRVSAILPNLYLPPELGRELQQAIGCSCETIADLERVVASKGF